MRHEHPPRTRVALYSHDTQGLGHVRRNLEIAGALVADSELVDVLIVSGTARAGALPCPERTELLVIPGVNKDVSGLYASAALRVGLEEVLDLRSRTLAAALESFQPDLLIVDKEARGLGGELDLTLERLRRISGAGGRRPRIVLGLREVLDDPRVARREWQASGVTATLREYYDAVWIYGDPAVFDLAESLDLPADVRDMVQHSGYLANGRGPRPTRLRRASHGPVEPPYVLCTVGGGQDGRELATAFAAAQLPRGHHGVLVTGPFMDDDTRDALCLVAASRPDLSVLEFVTDTPELVRGAAAVVSMGGYNSVCEVLASDVPCLVVPRVRPRREQEVRAERLARHGCLDTMRPRDLTPRRLGTWLRSAVTTPRRPRGIDLDGLARIPTLAHRLLDEAAGHPTEASHVIA